VNLIEILRARYRRAPRPLPVPGPVVPIYLLTPSPQAIDCEYTVSVESSEAVTLEVPAVVSSDAPQAPHDAAAESARGVLSNLEGEAAKVLKAFELDAVRSLDDLLTAHEAEIKSFVASGEVKVVDLAKAQIEVRLVPKLPLLAGLPTAFLDMILSNVAKDVVSKVDSEEVFVIAGLHAEAKAVEAKLAG